MSRKIPIPNSRPVFAWGCIQVAWESHGVSDRELCRSLGIDRKRLRERRDRGNWKRQRREPISALRFAANWLNRRGSIHGADYLDEAAHKRQIEFDIYLLRCREMIAQARAEKQ
jgi:hypothetical protein